MKIEFEGVAWQVDLDAVDMLQGDVIAGYTGLSVLGWYKSLMDTDNVAWNKSVRCLYWLMREQNPQNGGSVPVESVNFAPVKLFEAFNDAMTAQAGAAPELEADPTMPAGGSDAADLTPPLTPAG